MFHLVGYTWKNTINNEQSHERQTLHVLSLQEEGAQIHMSEWSQSCGQRFHPLLHTSYTVDCLTAPLGDDVSSGYYAHWERQ